MLTCGLTWAVALWVGLFPLVGVWDAVLLESACTETLAGCFPCSWHCIRDVAVICGISIDLVGCCRPGCGDAVVPLPCWSCVGHAVFRTLTCFMDE